MKIENGNVCEVIEGYYVEEFVEMLDGSVSDVKFEKDLGDGYGLYVRDDGCEFVFLNYGDVDNEYVWRVVGEVLNWFL